MSENDLDPMERLTEEQKAKVAILAQDMADHFEDPFVSPLAEEMRRSRGKPRASVAIVTAEVTEQGEMLLHLDDGTVRPATDEEIATYRTLNRAHVEAFVMNRHQAFDGDPKERPLPRHRPPRLKDPEAKTAPHLPPNVFGAPRAVR